jgi:SPP1 family predicted phage head-tail adaptor
MNANDLNRRVAIWKKSFLQNAAGTPIEPWQFLKHTYANLKVSGGGFASNDPEGKLATTYVTIIMRYDKEINYDCEIRYNNQTYSITYINPDFRKNFYTLTCTTYNEYD